MLILLLLVLFGILYGAIFGSSIIYIVGRETPFSKKTALSRVLAAILAFYVFLESFLTFDQSLGGFFVWLFLIPLVLGFALLGIARRKFANAILKGVPPGG